MKIILLKSRYLLVIIPLIAMAFLAMNRWAENRLGENEQRINLSPVEANIRRPKR